jgi:hypothetical protein
MQFQSGKSAIEFVRAWMGDTMLPSSLDNDSRREGTANG